MLYLPKSACVNVIIQTIQAGFSKPDYHPWAIIVVVQGLQLLWLI